MNCSISLSSCRATSWDCRPAFLDDFAKAVFAEHFAFRIERFPDAVGPDEEDREPGFKPVQLKLSYGEPSAQVDRPSSSWNYRCRIVRDGGVVTGAGPADIAVVGVDDHDQHGHEQAVAGVAGEDVVDTAHQMAEHLRRLPHSCAGRSRGHRH